MGYERDAKVSDMLGATLKSVSSVSAGDDVIRFEAEDGRIWEMYHSPDCCENVSIEDICGDLNDLVGSPLTMADESTSEENPKHEDEDSFLWTFYRLATLNGYVTIRWYGSSNGYYSESVDFVEVK